VSVGTRTRVFLSHTAADDRLATAVSDRLEELGFDVEPISGAGLNADASDFTPEFRQAIVASDVAAFLITPRSVGSESTAVVFGAALMADKPIFVLLDGVAAADLPAEYRPFPTLSAAEPSQFAEML
jgi:hypothetical protein